MGLAQERRPGVWQLDAELEGKLRRLGDRADKIKMMQRALEGSRSRSQRRRHRPVRSRDPPAPLVGKVVGVGLVDEITDRH